LLEQHKELLDLVACNHAEADDGSALVACNQRVADALGHSPLEALQGALGKEVGL
jgi:hypothetical protein